MESDHAMRVAAMNMYAEVIVLPAPGDKANGDAKVEL
jgi:hypothetical protein